MADCYSEGFEYDDRRRLSGNPIRDLRAATEQILTQYSQFETYGLAVRGKRLQLARCRWSNDSGFETTHLIVNETGEDGRFVYEGRFDEDDFDGAYRELDLRYYAGEGAAFAEAGTAQTEWLTALNERDHDRLFGELTATEMRFEMRSSSPFPNRSATELRTSVEDLTTWLASMRSWHATIRWLSATCFVSRNERVGVGLGGEQYAWTRIYVFEFEHGQCTCICEFELDNEAAAFAYAEERVRRAEDR
jgi:hypothetical protein